MRKVAELGGARVGWLRAEELPAARAGGFSGRHRKPDNSSTLLDYSKKKWFTFLYRRANLLIPIKENGFWGKRIEIGSFLSKIKFLESIHKQMKIHSAPLVQFLGNGINVKVTQNSRWGNQISSILCWHVVFQYVWHSAKSGEKCYHNQLLDVKINMFIFLRNPRVNSRTHPL